MSDAEVRLYHTDHIFGMTLDVFEDMCEFVWTTGSSDYLVVDMQHWVYMKNFRFSVSVSNKCHIIDLGE